MSRITPLVRAFLAQGTAADCPVVDMHAHPDRFKDIYFPDPEPDGILRAMDRCHVTAIVAAPHAALMDPVIGNAFTVSLIQRYPGRILGYWCYNPRYPEALEDAKAAPLTIPGIVGYKVHPTWSELPLTDKGYQPLFAWANEHRLIVLSHTWNTPGMDAAACRQLAEQYPEMRLLLGHCCWDDFGGAIELARTFTNVCLELTAAERMPGFVDRAVREGCARKLVFGSDFPWFDPDFGIGCVLFADIHDEDRHAILHGNAERLLAEAAPGVTAGAG